MIRIGRDRIEVRFQDGTIFALNRGDRPRLSFWIGGLRTIFFGVLPACVTLHRMGVPLNQCGREFVEFFDLRYEEGVLSGGRLRTAIRHHLPDGTRRYQRRVAGKR